MKNTLGSSLCVTLFGESHGPEIGAVLDGLSPGIKVDETYISRKLALRRPSGRISTARVEKDPFRIVSGVREGCTTGTPLTILIPNGDTKSKDYEKTRVLARPGHADYTAYCKYHGYEDYRGGGHFSGRITAALVAAGALVQSALEAKGIMIGTHIARCAGIDDREFADYDGYECAAGSECAVKDSGSFIRDIRTLTDRVFPVLDEEAGARMQEAIQAAEESGDSVGGVLETLAAGLPAGIGEPWFDTLEGLLAHALFSIPAVKGVEFGDGFAMADQRGSETNDSFMVKGDRIVTKTNHNGGINGGISNGMPIRFRWAVKPTPSIGLEQDTVDFISHKDKKLTIRGRHDPAIVHRARVVVDAVTALVIGDALSQRFGTDYLKGGSL